MIALPDQPTPSPRTDHSAPPAAPFPPAASELDSLAALALSTLCDIIRDPGSSAKDRRLAAVEILRFVDSREKTSRTLSTADDLDAPAPPAPTPCNRARTAPTVAAAPRNQPDPPAFVNLQEPPTPEEIAAMFAHVISREIASPPTTDQGSRSAPKGAPQNRAALPHEGASHPDSKPP